MSKRNKGGRHKKKRIYSVNYNNGIYNVVDQYSVPFDNFTTTNRISAIYHCNTINMNNGHLPEDNPYDDGSNGATRYFAGL